jgi:hypothetical protein
MDHILFQIGKNNENNNKNFVNQLYITYPILKSYDYITIDNIENMYNGDGYILYVNCNGELKNGGLFIKLINYSPKIKNPFLLSISNPSPIYINSIKLQLKLYNIMYNIQFYNNYIFYKKKLSKTDKFRNLLLDSIIPKS